MSTIIDRLMQLDRKVAFITGINNDIGRTTALTMAKAGAKIAIADEDVVRGEAIAAMIREGGGESFFQETDITMDEEVINSIANVAKRYGSLDIAFNNASFEGEYFPLAQHPEGLVAQSINFNFNSTWMCIKHEIRQMIEQNGGVIINNVGCYKANGRPGCAIYRANKAAIEAITKSAAVEYARYNIRVNAISPGILQSPTKLAQGIEADNAELPNSAFVPMGRNGKFKEVADSIVWLCSDRASFVTGHILPIDGGLKALAAQS